MEAAIARGQGKSTSGAALQKVTIEFIMPPTIAMIIDAETDNSNRTLGDLRHLIKVHGGNVTPTSYLFKKKGCVVFEKDEKKLGVDDVMDEAIEAGAEDLELDDDGNIVVWTDPSMTTATAESLTKAFDIKVANSDIIWDANEDTKVPLETGDMVQKLVAFIDAARDNQNVQGVYANVAQGSVEDGEWEDLTDRLDA
jgi:transcriptional/translational regulatory protein YebC/TACO1